MRGHILEQLQRAIALHQAGRIAEAEPLYRMILAADSRQFDALHLLGVIEAQRGRLPQAHDLLSRAVKINSRSADAYVNNGRVLRDLGRREEALASLNRAISLDRNHVVGLSNRGALLRELGRLQDAIADYDRALAIAPGHVEAIFNRGRALLDLPSSGAALQAFDQVLARQPQHADAWICRAAALRDLNRHDEALECYGKALALDPRNAVGLSSRGQTLQMMNRHHEAAADFKAALALDPSVTCLMSNAIYSNLHNCDWAELDNQTEKLLEGVRSATLTALPFHLLSLESTLADQFQCAKQFATECYTYVPKPFAQGRPGNKIRVAYVSADLREHPVSYLMVGLFEQHDRDRFEVTGISLSIPDLKPFGQRVRAAFDHFVDAYDKSDDEVVALMREMQIDIAVDLMGHTAGMRRGIFGRRAAPVQVSYLGYPGTSGFDYFDYLIADRVVIPREDEQYFTEKVVALPGSFQPNDSKRSVADTTPGRAAQNLPEGAFVFCSFNNAFKITPRVFDVWMRLLGAVEGSVLWLTANNEIARENLRREAQQRGIDPVRLVFATRVEHNEDHLARYRHADIFLDTEHYNAHSTASDALWVGVPVVTCPGETYASRVAHSVLAAMDLEELVAPSFEEYEALALRLSKEPAQLAALKEKVMRNRATSPLFDTGRIRRHIEAAYLEMIERHRRGEAPAAFEVAPLR